MGSADAGVGNLGGGITLDLLLDCRTALGDDSRFSLSDEKDAAGEGDSDPGFAEARPGLCRVKAVPNILLSSSSSRSEGGLVRRAILMTVFEALDGE